MLAKMIKNLFFFSKKERNGIIVFVILILIILFIPTVYKKLYKETSIDISKEKAEIDAYFALLEEKLNKEQAKVELKTKKSQTSYEPSYFEFDPNTADSITWLKLGLSPNKIHVILNFINKGGHFYKKEDLQKIYSISGKDYLRLVSYIKIKEVEKKSFELPKKEDLRKNSIIEINSADTIDLQSLKGIGPSFSKRIVKYRNMLGGFYSKSQLLEVYGLDKERFDMFGDQVRIDTSGLQKININTGNYKDLIKHPYFNKKEVSAIMEYRRVMGLINTMDELVENGIISKNISDRIKPYIAF